MNVETFIFYGLAGSGKGTQVECLIDVLKKRDNFNCVHISTGNEFRKLTESKNYTSQIIEEIINKGELQPDFLTNAVFANMLITSLNNEKHLITDGYPRTISQSESFEEMMKFYKRENIKIIYIKLSETEAIRRNLLRGRADDTEEGMKKRIEEFKNSVIPSMNYFKEKENYKIYIINGEQSIEAVHADIIKALGY